MAPGRHRSRKKRPNGLTINIGEAIRIATLVIEAVRLLAGWHS